MNMAMDGNGRRHGTLHGQSECLIQLLFLSRNHPSLEWTAGTAKIQQFNSGSHIWDPIINNYISYTNNIVMSNNLQEYLVNILCFPKNFQAIVISSPFWVALASLVCPALTVRQAACSHHAGRWHIVAQLLGLGELQLDVFPEASRPSRPARHGAGCDTVLFVKGQRRDDIYHYLSMFDLSKKNELVQHSRVDHSTLN